MEPEEYLRPDFRVIIDEFAEFRNTYIALKAYCRGLEEASAGLKERLRKVTENLEKMMETCLMLQKQHKTVGQEFQYEKDSLRKKIEELQEQCEDLRIINAGINADAAQIHGLKDEIERLKTQVAAQKEQHKEDVALLKQRHSDEIQRYKMLLQNAKQKTNRNTKRDREKNADANRRDKSCFRWPQLDIDKLSDVPANDEGASTSVNKRNKKRRLFHEDEGTVIDV